MRHLGDLDSCEQLNEQIMESGMPEMLKPTSLIMGAGLGQDVACVTDGRFSGG